MPQTTRQSFAQVRSWLHEINREKSAATKSAKAYAEPGGYTGETTHPIKDVDDGLEKATTGSHAAENEKDQKDRPFAGVVDETSEGGAPTQEELSLNIGVKQAPTGEAPEVEDDYKGTLKDPGTSSPMNADEVGEKYGAWVKKEASVLAGLANDILADIATGVGLSDTKPQQKQAAAPAAKPSTQQKAPTQEQSVQAGYELASLLGLDKQAADKTAEHVLTEIIKKAQLSADRVGPYLLSFLNEEQAILKAAEGLDEAGGMPPEAGGPPPGPGGPEGGAPADPATIAALAGGAGGPPPEAGGAPPGGPEAGGGGDHEAALQELAMALMELGISPEELQQLAAGGAGGAPGGAEAPPPGPGSPGDVGAKIASAVKDYKRSGRFKVSEAKTAAQQTQRNEMKRYLLEILGATRN